MRPTPVGITGHDSSRVLLQSLRTLKLLKRFLSRNLGRFKDDLKNSDKKEGIRRNLGDIATLSQVTKTLNLFYILIRTNSFLGGKVYFRVVGEQILNGH